MLRERCTEFIFCAADFLSSACQMPRINFEDPIGRYAISGGRMRLEYQIGSMLIWVHFPDTMRDQNALTIAGTLIDSAMDGMANAVQIAEQKSREQLPDFWEVHDQSGLDGDRLAVWSLSLDVDSHSVEYEVGRNHGFFGKSDIVRCNLPNFPDLMTIEKSRNEEWSFLLRAKDI
jgi:hypothetical protein